MNRILMRLSLSVGIVMPVVVIAQAQPDAGALQRETARDGRGRLLTVPLAVPAPMKEAAKGASVTVRAFVIGGAALVPADELAALLADAKRRLPNPRQPWRRASAGGDASPKLSWWRPCAGWRKGATRQRKRLTFWCVPCSRFAANCGRLPVN